jgi:two-component system cell cycle sensor histidine kinase/response regulator CckA
VPGRMGGEEAMRRLRAIDPSAIAIVSSGYSDSPVMARFAEHGFAGVASKPYTAASLLEVVEEVASRRPA